jgi:sulfur-oxidizing protein SoxX
MSIALEWRPCLVAIGLLMGSCNSLAETATNIEVGKTLAFDRDKGNCLACHAIEDGELPGNVAPPLLAMQQRFPLRADLVAQIWDAGGRNPRTTMPPFGRHRILSDEEVEAIVSYLYSL